MCGGEVWGVLAPVGGAIVQVASVHRRHRNLMATTASGWTPRLAAGWAPTAAILMVGTLVPTFRVAVGFVASLLVDASAQAEQIQVGEAIQEFAAAHFFQKWEGGLYARPRLLCGSLPAPS